LEILAWPFQLISKLIDYNNKNQAADATKRGTELQVIRHEELVGLSKKGNAEAQNELGFNYFHGVGVSRDREQAMTLYRLSALQDHAEAQNNLGLCYYTNIEGHGDPIEACALWRLAAPTFPKAQINLTYAEGKLPADSLLAITKRTDELRAEIAATLGKKALPPASK
jgi:TPR repeat protein